MIVLETTRLILRPFRDADLDSYAAMCADPDVMRYLNDGNLLSREDAWRQLAMFTGHWVLRGFGTWALEEKATGAYVGRAGLHYPEGWPDREVGWALHRSHWGKGYATEAAHAAVTHAFDTLGWSRIISVIHPDNFASIRVAERLGERFAERTTVGGSPASIYALDRKDWTGRG